VNTGGGTPSIPITVGAVVKNATYISGSGTNALVFRYTVASGDVDNNGIAIGSAIALNGGTMKDAATADVLLTLNSIGNTTGVLVEAVPPTVSSINRQTPGTSLTNASTLVYRVTFSESVTGVDITDFALTATGTAAGTIASVSSSSGTTIDVTVNTVTGDGTLRLDMNASGTGITDVPGNPLSGGFATGQTYSLDHTSPAITSNGGGSTANISIAENATAVTTVTATDANPITYSIAGGADQAKFSMNVSGALTFSAAPDFESPADADANNTYIVIVRASDGFNNKDQTITVTITNVNDNPPAITSNGGGNNATVSVPELTTAVTKVTATDADAGTTIIYSISGGADAGKFDINSSTGDLTFKTAPVYLVPTDADANNSYLVTVRASDGTFNDDQAITVNVTSSTPLPVMLTELRGSQNGSGIELIWKTTSEINIERFEVEKSNNGNGFIKVADVKASGSGANSTSYGWLDKNYYAGNNFYRLKMVDRNGDWKYSSVIRINLSAKGAFIKVTPNPVRNKTLGLQLNNISQGRYELVLYNATGQRVFNKVIDHSGGISAQNIQLPSQLGSGLYKIKLISSKESFNATLIIE
ncbi:MAG: Cadherin domain protein, partial [Segetibacter sp.]|nr:Cadherin domain protein [Segetibacter sp.]